MDNIRYSLQHQDGKVVRIQYEVKDDASATTEAAQANELAAKITGVSSRCKSSNGMELCHYRKGTTQITIRSYQSPARLNVSASSQCK